MKIKCYLLRCTTQTALHIGTQQQPDDVSDSLFRRTANGDLVLPGTGIAGAIRAHLTRLLPALTRFSLTQTVCESLHVDGDIDSDNENQPYTSPDHLLYDLMGDLKPDRENQSVTIRASRLIVNDAVIETATHIRDGVGIDRMTGTAARAANAKYDVETIPAGTSVTITLEIEHYRETADDESMGDDYVMALMLVEWQAGHIRFGGDTARGLGVLKIDEVVTQTYDLSQPAHLMTYLRHESSPDTSTIAGDALTQPGRPYHGSYDADRHQRAISSVWHRVTFEFTLAAEGFFLTNDINRAVEEGFDHYSLPLLPGSSLRGVIRSQAERIARTIANSAANSEDDFLARCPASDPFVMHWSRHEYGLESTASRIHRSSQLSPQDKAKPPYGWFDLAEQLFGTTFHGSRLVVDDARLLHAAKWKKLDFVAIDRFTGGAADKMKFDAVALWQPAFQCRLHLEDPEHWQVGWLLLVLRDLRDGLLPVGFGGSKGFGDVTLKDLQVTFAATYDDLYAGMGLVLRGDGFFKSQTITDWDRLIPSKFIDAWQEQVSAYRVPSTVPYHRRHDPLPDGKRQPPLDPYWAYAYDDKHGSSVYLADLYPTGDGE